MSCHGQGTFNLSYTNVNSTYPITFTLQYKRPVSHVLQMGAATLLITTTTPTIYQSPYRAPQYYTFHQVSVTNYFNGFPMFTCKCKFHVGQHIVIHPLYSLHLFPSPKGHVFPPVEVLSPMLIGNP